MALAALTLNEYCLDWDRFGMVKLFSKVFATTLHVGDDFMSHISITYSVIGVPPNFSGVSH